MPIKDFYVHFGMEMLDGNAKMRIKSKNVHKPCMRSIESDKFIHLRKRAQTTMETCLPNKFLNAHQKRHATL